MASAGEKEGMEKKSQNDGSYKKLLSFSTEMMNRMKIELYKKK
jgi:hypothetical protein